jgi:hypothetical protein
MTLCYHNAFEKETGASTEAEDIRGEPHGESPCHHDFRRAKWAGV